MQDFRRIFTISIFLTTFLLFIGSFVFLFYSIAFGKNIISIISNTVNSLSTVEFFILLFSILFSVVFLSRMIPRVFFRLYYRTFPTGKNPSNQDSSDLASTERGLSAEMESLRREIFRRLQEVEAKAADFEISDLDAKAEEILQKNWIRSLAAISYQHLVNELLSRQKTTQVE